MEGEKNKVVNLLGKEIITLKVGDWVNLRGNFDPENRGMEFWGPVKINDKVINQMINLSDKEEEIFKQAFGMRWKILKTDFVKDIIRITTKFNDGLYGKVLEMNASHTIMTKSKNQRE